MSVEATLSLINSVALISASVIPFYLALREKIRPLRVLSALLGLFAFSHGAYHYLSAFVVGYAGRAVLDTLSVVFLLLFIIYSTIRGGWA